MTLAILAFLAGMLSVLAPCVLPVLPVILGGSLGSKQRYRPLIIIGSTAFCITVFTRILKATSSLLAVPEHVRLWISSGIIILYGLTLIRPHGWEHLQYSLGLYKTNRIAQRAKKHSGWWGDILLGASLGPIFASCSPTYGLLLSVVFPQSVSLGLLYTFIYSLGFALLLLIIAYGGRAVILKLRWASNPYGVFKKVLGVVLILTGILIATGRIKDFESALLDTGLGSRSTDIEQQLLHNFQNDLGPSTASDTLTGSTSYTGVGARYLEENYPAPDFVGLQNWVNTKGRDSLQALRGKVVVIDFWTYSCINCIRTLPYLEKLYQTYKDWGLVVIGVHAPEFQFERNIRNVQTAVKKYGLSYPVVQDNDFLTWRAFHNYYRPAKYIIDKDGIVRYQHFGEGAYRQTEEVIQSLLGVKLTPVIKETAGLYVENQTPETYLGTARREHFSSSPSEKLHDRWLAGQRRDEEEKIRSTADKSTISINAVASEVNLVMGSDRPVSASVYVDNKRYKDIVIDGYQLYNLYRHDSAGEHRVIIRVDGAGVDAYAYTFG